MRYTGSLQTNRALVFTQPKVSVDLWCSKAGQPKQCFLSKSQSLGLIGALYVCFHFWIWVAHTQPACASAEVADDVASLRAIDVGTKFSKLLSYLQKRRSWTGWSKKLQKHQEAMVSASNVCFPLLPYKYSLHTTTGCGWPFYKSRKPKDKMSKLVSIGLSNGLKWLLVTLNPYMWGPNWSINLWQEHGRPPQPHLLRAA